MNLGFPGRRVWFPEKLIPGLNLSGLCLLQHFPSWSLPITLMIIIPYSGIDPNRDTRCFSHKEKSIEMLDPKGPVQAGSRRSFILILHLSCLSV
jgi:hypothetical protein